MTSSRLAQIAAQRWSDPAFLLAGMALLGIAAVAAALVTQHAFDMQPCPWCVLQRVIFLAISLVCAVGLVWRRATERLVVAGLGALLALAGIGCALWQHFYAAASASCKITVAERIVSALGLDTLWPDVFLATASCADAAATLLGVPYPFWSLALFVLMGAGCVRVLWQARPGRTGAT